MSKLVYISIVGYLIFLLGCSSTTNYSSLSFFFDGISNPNETKHIKNNSTTYLINRNRSKKVKKNNVIKYFAHGPYGAKLCGDCHNVKQGFTLLKQEPQLCYGCHTRFEKFPKFPHGPVYGGYCSTCHHPHRSKNRSLLLISGNGLCYKCHKESSLFNKEVHLSSREKECIKCHNPHGNNKQYFL